MIKSITILKENQKRLSIRFSDKEPIYFTVSIDDPKFVGFSSTDIGKAFEHFKAALNK